MNKVTVEFAKGGFVVTTEVVGQGSTVEVVTSTGKLNKALRTAIEGLSLLPKKADKDDADE